MAQWKGGFEPQREVYKRDNSNRNLKGSSQENKIIIKERWEAQVPAWPSGKGALMFCGPVQTVCASSEKQSSLVNKVGLSPKCGKG